MAAVSATPSTSIAQSSQYTRASLPLARSRDEIADLSDKSSPASITRSTPGTPGTTPEAACQAVEAQVLEDLDACKAAYAADDYSAGSDIKASMTLRCA